MAFLDSFKPLRVQPGAANYYCYPGAIEKLRSFFTDAELSRSITIAGARAERAASEWLPDMIKKDRDRVFRFSGHCTKEFVRETAAKSPENASLVIGIGGGSALDAAKAFAVRLDRPFVAIPTVAATCAACTPLSVWYSPTGAALGYETFRRAPDLTLVEPRIILDAPPEFLRAGIADTLAKWYEASVISGNEARVPLPAAIGLEIARMIHDLLFEKAESALESLRWRELTTDFIDVLDAILAGAAAVGGFGERFTRIAAAHAIHNGLSALPETAERLHGTKVAYGIVVQKALEGNEVELRRLILKFRTLALPTSLVDLGVDANDLAKVKTIVDTALKPGESMEMLPFPVDERRLTEAIAAVETGNREMALLRGRFELSLDSSFL